MCKSTLSLKVAACLSAGLGDRKLRFRPDLDKMYTAKIKVGLVCDIGE